LNATLLKSKQTRLWATCSALLRPNAALGITILPCLWSALSVAVLTHRRASVDRLYAIRKLLTAALPLLRSKLLRRKLPIGLEPLLGVIAARPDVSRLCCWVDDWAD
jgi:hypothetical protein